MDLPAPKPNPASAKAKGTQLGLGKASPLAAAPAAAAPKIATSDSASDLPALKRPGAAPKIAPAFDVPDLADLPAPKPNAPVGRPLPNTQLSPGLAGDLSEPSIDLPAPKPAAAAKPGPRIAPDFGSPKSADSAADLPALKAKPGASAAKLTPEKEPARKLAPEIDLPARKPAAETARAQPVDVDLPALKPAGLTSAAANAQGFELDLPAPKPAQAAKPAAIAPSFELDLPAPKPAQAAKPAAIAPSFELDLPAPKPAPAANAQGFELDLPAPKPAPAAAKPAIAPSFELDLPAPKPAATAKAPQAAAKAPAEKPASSAPDLDLPAPKPSPDRGKGLDLDLPAPKAAARPAEPAHRSFAKPGAAASQAKPVAQAKSAAQPAPAPAKPAAVQPAAPKPAAASAQRAAQSMPKDSLAIDPEPFFAGLPKGGQFGDLDDIGAADSGLDLPAPSDLPQLKPTAGKPAPKGTMLGIGNKLPKDSLDLPGGLGGFEQAVEIVGSPFASEDLPAPADLPTVKKAKAPSAPPIGELDLPAPGDLPTPKKGKPAGTAMGIGPLSRDSLDLPPSRNPLPPSSGTAMGIGALLGDEFTLPEPQPARVARDSLSQELNLPGGGAGGSAGGSSIGIDDLGLDLPPAGADALEPSAPLDLGSLGFPPAQSAPKRGGTFAGATMALSPDDLELPGADAGSSPLHSLGNGPKGLPLPGAGDMDLFGDPSPAASRANQTMDLDSMFELGSSAQPARGQSPAASSNSFGELDFGLSAEPMPLPVPMPQPIPQDRGFDTRSVEAELLGGDGAAIDAPATKKKKKKARTPGKPIPGWVWPLLLLAVLAGGGASLGLFTPYGYFGVYFLEQLLPAAGDPARVAEAIGQAEKQAKSDTYVDVRKSLVTLSDARNEAGLNRELLARSLLHEALYQLRFGEDTQSAQRSVAILARVMERGSDVPGLTLARAADAARSGDLPKAKALLAEAPADDQPYRGLVAGEIALLAKQPEVALKEFERAGKANAGARAQWGVTRALIALGKLDEAEAAGKQALAQSPRHSAALAFAAERAMAHKQLSEALALARQATGAVPIGGSLARPSRGDRAHAYALEGRIEENLEHPREAHASYERALAADPLAVDVLIGSGRVLMRLGRVRDALARFDSALGAKPASTPDAEGRIPLVEAGNGAAQALLAQERYQEAFARSNGLVKQFAEHPEVNLWLGHALLGLEKWDEAEAAFRKSIDLAPRTFAGYVGLSQLLFKRDRPEEGARVLTEATGKVEDSAEVRRMLGNSELTRNHLPEAVHHFQAALRFDAKDAGSLFGLAIAQRKIGEIDAAEKTLARLAKVDPTFPGLPLERGQLLENRGDYAAAVEAYRKALEERPQDIDLKLRLGATLVTAGRVDEADALLKQVLKERPTSAEAEHFIGRILFARKETDLAVQRFERAVNFDTLRAEYHMYLAWASLEQGNLSGALESVTKAIERDPNLGDAHWILGRVQLRTGAVKDALESFQRALRLKPGRVEALAGMADAYDELRDLSAAIKAYQEAVKQVPENGEWWYRLGSLHIDRGSRDEARVALAEAVLRGDRVIEKPTWLADAHRVYGDVLRESGRSREALDHYRLFLELVPPGHPDRRDVEQIIKASR